MRSTAILVICSAALVLFGGCQDERRAAPAKTVTDGAADKKGDSGGDSAPKVVKPNENEKTKAPGNTKRNTKGRERGTHLILGDRTVDGKRFRSVATFGPGIYNRDEEIKRSWPIVAAEYAKLKIGMRMMEEVGPILGFDEFWYVPHTPSDRVVVVLEDMEGKSLTLTFAGDWPDTKLVAKKSQDLK